MAFLSTNMINRLLRAGHIKKFSLSTLKVIVFAGAVIKPKVHEEIRCILSHVQILQMFGKKYNYSIYISKIRQYLATEYIVKIQSFIFRI